MDDTLAKCCKGDRAVLMEVKDEQLSIQLFCMGCVLGETIQIERVAPFGDPIIISYDNSFISLRRNDAKNMRVKKQ